MKSIVLVGAVAAAGALAGLVIPTTIVSSGANELRQIPLAELNPFRAIWDSAQRQIRAGMTPEQLGLRSSAITVSPMALSPPASLKLDLGRAFEVQAQSQIDQSIRHTQDMQAYTNNPSAWPGPPPN